MRLASFGVLVVGILLGVLLRHFVFDGSPIEKHSAPLTMQPPSAGAPVDLAAQRLDTLERELRRLQFASDAGGPSMAAVRATEAPALRDAAAQRLADFERESIDSIWASRMRAEIDKALLELETSGTVHFRSSVECRSSKCVARLTWPDFKTARNEYMLADTPSLECARSLHFDEPRDVEVPFEAKLMFECRR